MIEGKLLTPADVNRLNELEDEHRQLGVHGYDWEAVRRELRTIVDGYESVRDKQQVPGNHGTYEVTILVQPRTTADAFKDPPEIPTP